MCMFLHIHTCLNKTVIWNTVGHRGKGCFIADGLKASEREKLAKIS